MSTLIWDDENVLQHILSYMSYASDSVYLFGADRACCPMLSWGRASNQIGYASPLFRGLLFLLMDYIVPSICVTESGIPNSEIDRKMN
jgi:hypothetical protein